LHSHGWGVDNELIVEHNMDNALSCMTIPLYACRGNVIDVQAQITGDDYQ